MKLLFNLNYITAFGEELVLNVLQEDGSTQKKYHMTTVDGQEWHAEVTIDEGLTTPHVDYFYSVERNCTTLRKEWLIEPHRLTSALFEGQETLVIYDRWIDIPDDAPLYSAAFTQRYDLQQDEEQAIRRLSSSIQTIVLKVRAPQLRHNERLAIMGDVAALGEWTALKAKKMVEQQPNEWVIKLDVAKFDRPVFEFKFVALDEKDDVTLLWECCKNRSIVLLDV